MLVDVNMGAGMYAYGKASKKPVKHLIMLDKVRENRPRLSWTAEDEREIGPTRGGLELYELVVKL